MASRGLAQRRAHRKRWHAQRSPCGRSVWREGGAAWDRDLSGLEDRNRTIVVLHHAPRVEACMQQGQQPCSNSSTPAWTPSHAQESEVTHAPTLYDL
jgi:hypothetical protein